MNEVFLDTETTGLSFKDGHKIVEIACVETKDLIATGNVFHRLINPQRNVPEDAFRIHGFSEKFLSSKETFDKIVYLMAIIAGCLCIIFAVNQKSPVTSYRNLTILIAPTAYVFAIILSNLEHIHKKTNPYSLIKLVPLVALSIFAAVSLKVSSLNISHKAYSIYDYKLLAEAVEKSGICNQGCYTTDYNPNGNQWVSQKYNYYFSNLRLTYLDPDDLSKSNKMLTSNPKRLPIIGSMQAPGKISAIKARFCYQSSEAFSIVLNESIDEKRVARKILPFALESTNKC
mgnify:CR=1 FL=1